MSEEFGTVNMRRGDRSREIEVLRQQYKRHRETLTGMIADAPTEYLATEYQRLIVELDASLQKLNELEAPRAATAAGAVRTGTSPGVDTQPMRTDPGKRPLVSTPGGHYETPMAEPGHGNRTLLIAIIVAALTVLAILAWLMLRSGDERPVAPIVTETAVPVEETDETTTISPAPPMTSDAPSVSIAIQPASHNFGVIRKGTRAVRQYELTNSTDQPMTITIARSACRCLYYSHSPVVAPKGKETITVTIDGARAKPGVLQETIKVSSKSDPSVVASMNVSATVR
jgi:hypothetical protein